MKKNLLKSMDPSSVMLLQEIGQIAEDLKMKAYLVGGPVRDLMLKHQSLDLDIMVEGNGMILAKAFAKKKQAKVVFYPAFLTSTITLKDGRVIDVVTARKETYKKPGSFPLVVASSVEDDLFRRDFTINAMAIAIGSDQWGKLIDPFGGKKDLLAKRIRILHEKSFVDDPTRILRAERFKSRLGFTIERKTLSLLNQAKRNNAFDTITKSRYLKEYNKILKERKLDGAY